MEAHATKPQVIHALEKLMGLPVSEDGEVQSARVFHRNKYIEAAQILRTYGAFVAAQTGMGKTIMILFFISWMLENHLFPAGTNKPTLVACPAILVESWALEAQSRFPNLEIAIMNAEAGNFEDPTLSSRAHPTEFNKKLPSLKGCPKWAKPAWENKDKRNFWVLFASVDTLTSRTIKEVPDPNRGPFEQKIRTNDGREKIRIVFPTMWVSNMKDMFNLVVMDEGHKYKNPSTQAWASIKRLLPSLVLIVSATPMISSVSGSWTSPIPYPNVANI